MADNTPNSLDAKAEAPPPAAPEPTPATPTPTPAKTGVWAGLTGKQKLLVVAGGSVIAAVGGMYGAKQLSPMPARAVAQTPPAVAAADPDRKPEADPRPPVKTDQLTELPPVAAPPLKPAPGKSELEIQVPDTLPPTREEIEAARARLRAAGDNGTGVRTAGGVGDITPPPMPSPLPELTIPEPRLGPKPTPDPAKRPDPGYTAPRLPVDEKDGKKDDPALKLPDIPSPPGPDLKIVAPGAKPPTAGPKPAEQPDPFKAPGKLGDEVPTVTMPSKIKPDAGPVIRTGGQDTPPTPVKKEEPSGLKIDPALALPPEPAKKPGATDIPTIDLPPPPPLPPIPGVDDKPPAGGRPTLPEVKPTAPPPPEVKPAVPLPDPPKIEVSPVPPTVGARPAVAPAPAAAKKDAYEEDWHTPESGQTYEWISTFYYKTADYAKALKAYNRDRQKPGEIIIRVPPTWVLDERFPDLTGKDPKPPAGLKFDPVEPAGGSRPAPPPAVGSIGSSDEYRVTTDAGEKIKEIARKVYGDPNAWKKLLDMNPGLDPTEPIPAGTTLRIGK